MSTASVTNTFVNAATADADEVNTNFSDLITFLNGSVVHTDGSKAFTGNVSGITPTAAAHLTRKDYVDPVGQTISTALATTPQTLTSSTDDVKIELNDIAVANTAYFTADIATNYRITVTYTGTYLVQGAIKFATDTTGFRRIAIYKDGTVNASNTMAPTTGVVSQIQVMKIIKVNANSYFELFGAQNSGGDLAVQIGAASTYLAVTKLDPGF